MDCNRLDLKLDMNKAPFVRSHALNGYHLRINKEKNRIILILRNYKETSIRRCGDKPDCYSKYLKDQNCFNAIAKRIKFFESWPEESRYVIYYEDLMLSPRESMQEILDFLEEDNFRLDDYIKNLDQLKEYSLRSYDKQRPGNSGSYSKGRDLLFHSKKMPRELLIRADELFRKKHPYIWNKYLSRYHTD